MNGSQNETNMAPEALVLPANVLTENISENQLVETPVPIVEAPADRTTETSPPDEGFSDVGPTIEGISTMITKTENMIQGLEAKKASIESDIANLDEVKAGVEKQLATAQTVLSSLKSGKNFFGGMKDFVESQQPLVK